MQAPKPLQQLLKGPQALLLHCAATQPLLQ
jgi:hypothetical protein